jgi:hypothetical protein
MRFVVGLFLIAHGLVHLMYLGPRPEDDPRYPFVPETRWLSRVLGLEAGTAKAIAGALAVLCALILVVAGISLFMNAGPWEPAAVIGAAMSLALLLLFFHPWLMIGITIDLAIIAGVTAWHVPSSLFDG